MVPLASDAATSANSARAGDIIQSFVVRMWLEAPGQWRGTVRSVQSQAQRGVSSVRQASAFMDEQCRAAAAAIMRERIPPRTREVHVPSLSGGHGARRLIAAGMATTVLIVGLVSVLFMRAPDGEVLLGTASSSGPPSELLPFVAGTLVGGIIMLFWRRK